MPLTAEFLEAVKPVDRNWSMGVELASPFIYSLLRCIRPRRSLEVGAGYSSLFILQALHDNYVEDQENARSMQGHVRSDQHTGVRRLLKGRHPLPLALPDYYDKPLTPRLLVIDDSSHPSTSADKVTEVAKALGLDTYLKFYEGDFRHASRTFGAELVPFDFVWFDCGGLEDFQPEYWPLIDPDGGMLMIHSTLANPRKRAFIKRMKEQLLELDGREKSFEILSVLEPHKWRQNSFTLIRMVSAKLEASYTDEE